MAYAPAIQKVVEALQVLHHNPDSSAKEKANAWLGEFQKSDEAWSTAQLILFAPDAPLETKLFAAQTFRSKITYDLPSLPGSHRLPLRDSLLTALKTFASGPRVILTHVSIALADLALQLTASEWSDPPTSMIDQLGKDPLMAGALLEFLQVLAEEFNSNFRLDVRPDFGRPASTSTTSSLASSTSSITNGTHTPTTMKRGSPEGEQVVSLISMYLTAPGITPQLQNQSFTCLSSWLKSGLTASSTLAGSPIVTAAFSSLSSESLFDNAVDFLVALIHETQELDDNLSIIQEIVPRLNELKPLILSKAAYDKDEDEDGDKLRGYTRVLVEAGEFYIPLILAHPESFLPLVENIALCAAGPHLPVVEITTTFWRLLADGLRRHVRREGAGGGGGTDPKYQGLVEVFAGLVGTIIGKLHYPYDGDAVLVGQERDDFRAFRHSIGDTLKDCCTILGAEACLQRSYDIISTTLSSGTQLKWQDLEAPLFSMRSMGAEVDPQSNSVLPAIMDLLPRLPSHPRIRYAATLVLGRYTQFINYHPSHIAFVLPYVSAGLEDPDVEVSAAAAQAMKYLCKDCSHHLVPYLGELHTFVQSIGTKLGPEDQLDITAAIAHVILAMPPQEAPQALGMFCAPLLQTVHSVTASPKQPPTKEELRAATDAFTQLDMYLAIIDHFPEGLPPSCAGTAAQAWTILDAFLAAYGSNPVVSEKACIALRRGLQFFPEDDTFPLSVSVLHRLAQGFEDSAASSYLWIMGKMVAFFARRQDRGFEEALKGAFERQSAKLFQLLGRNPPNQLADVLDDYVRLLYDLLEFCPDLLILSPAFSSAFQATLSAATLLSPSIVLAALDTIRGIITSPLDSSPPAFTSAITSVIDSSALQLVTILVEGLVDGMEDVSSNCLTVLRVMAGHYPNQLAASVERAVETLQPKAATPTERVEFLQKFNAAFAAQNVNQIKDAFTWLLRSSRKTRDRARVLESRDR